MNNNYLYQFRVLTSDLLDHEDITAYVRPLKGENVSCRVERATPANFVARQRREIQLLIFSSGVVFVALLISYLRRKPEGDRDETQPHRRTLRPSDFFRNQR